MLSLLQHLKGFDVVAGLRQSWAGAFVDVDGKAIAFFAARGPRYGWRGHGRISGAMSGCECKPGRVQPEEEKATVCGILVTHGVNRPFSHRSLRALKKRGPDQIGFWADSYVQMAHTRLAIIGLDDRGAEPLENDTHVLTFNGEIYNYNEIRARLQAHGVVIRGGNDAEVLLHAWSPPATAGGGTLILRKRLISQAHVEIQIPLETHVSCQIIPAA